jgi:hypothetical protein
MKRYKVGVLNWEVGNVDLMTADDPPSPVLMRKALVRSDHAAGGGPCSSLLYPIQNCDAGMPFDAIFGRSPFGLLKPFIFIPNRLNACSIITNRHCSRSISARDGLRVYSKSMGM